ncbi:MAG: Rrf2 family transcriptional regulator [Betaproteobacteria bacterium]|nr:Rrf2 family transcriptional regulator [Betaproteobacteria bacterium]
MIPKDEEQKLGVEFMSQVYLNLDDESLARAERLALERGMTIEQLFAKLRRHTLVDSVRGPGGGYTLARDAEVMSVADIIIAVDEALDATQCGGRENCLDEQRCMTHELWSTLNDKMYEYLHSVKLSELVAAQHAKIEERRQAVLHDKRKELAVPA